MCAVHLRECNLAMDLDSAQPDDRTGLTPRLPRFRGAFESQPDVNHDYGQIFCLENPGSSAERLVIGAQSGHLEWMETLATELPGPWHLLFLLTLRVPDRWEAGRYASPPIADFASIQDFHRQYRPMLEGDGRHHYWIGNASQSGLLVYDHHNVIYAYGPLRRFEVLLRQGGFEERKVEFPVPHIHLYHPEHDEIVAGMLARYPWIYSPLQDGDDY